MADTGVGAGVGSTGDVLLQLCGEILLSQRPVRQPTILRAGAAVGLELLDLLLNPSYVLRATEELTLRNTQLIGRNFRVDISLDQLSRKQEVGATQLSALVSRRVGLDDRSGLGGSSDVQDPEVADLATKDLSTVGNERLWIPLDTVPRPLAAAVPVSDADGTPLPRPPQREVQRTLEAALYHILRESLRVHPDFDPQGANNRPVTVLMRRDDPARWLLQSALISVCRLGPATPRSEERWQAMRPWLGQVGPAGLSKSKLFELLDKLAAGRTAIDGSAHRTAFAVLRDALSEDEPFLELVRLVHGHYFVVAGLDRRVRDHSVTFNLPESEAQDASMIKSLYRRTTRTFDAREHNYTVRVLVPVPSNFRQYNLLVRTAPEPRGYSYNEVSVIGAVHYDDHPGRRALDALRTCAQELTSSLARSDEVADDSPTGTDFESSRLTGVQAERVRFVASRAIGALDPLSAIVGAQDHAAEYLEARWGRASTRTVRRSAERLKAVAAEAGDQLARTRAQLEVLSSYPYGTGLAVDEVERAAEVLDAAVAVLQHDLLATQLVTNDLPGQEVARIRLDRSMLASTSAPRPRTLEVWATITDETRPFAYSAIGPPISLAALVYATGALVFDKLTWPVHVWSEPQTIPTAEPDAIAAVLLLAPALAATQFTVPDRWSVAGRLRRPARLFVLAAIGILGGTAMIVATQLGSADHPPEHPLLLSASFLGALGCFLVWSVWAATASAVRSRYSWRPKGLRSLFGIDTFLERTRIAAHPVIRPLLRLVRIFSYDSKAPDADFDLTLPTRSFPSHTGQS